MATIAIIPARGGSKGIPGKNLLDICGKPLVVWSIEQAQACPLIDLIYVPTDSEEIARVATAAGVTVIYRSDFTATDSASTESVLFNVLTKPWMDSDIDPITDVVLLQPTSPIRQGHDISEAIGRRRGLGADSCFSGRIVEGYTWQSHSGNVSPNYNQRRMRQKLDSKTIEENGSIYVFTPDTLMTYNSRLGGEVCCHIMHPLDSFQIDDQDDVKLIETLIPLRLEKQLRQSSAISTVCSAPTQTENMKELPHIVKTYN